MYLDIGGTPFNASLDPGNGGIFYCEKDLLSDKSGMFIGFMLNVLEKNEKIKKRRGKS
jgi:hypothetical protein